MNLEPWYSRPLILAYHSISSERQDGLSVRVQDFSWQMHWLAGHGYRSLTVSEMMRGEFRQNERIVVITFDDGYADNYTQAFPILKQFEFTATIFLVTDHIGQDHVYWWDRNKAQAASDRRLFCPLNWEQVFEMTRAGIEFGSHTCSHPAALTKLSPDQCWTEISESRAVLRKRLGGEVTSFCYPRGDLNPDVVQMVAAAGYTCAVVTPPLTGIPLTRYTLRRISLYREYGSTMFRLLVTPFFRRNYDHFKRLRRAISPGLRKQNQALQER